MSFLSAPRTIRIIRMSAPAVAGISLFAAMVIVFAEGRQVLTHRGGTASLMDGGQCDFNVREDQGKLVPIDLSTGEVLGLFERLPDGDVQLTTPEGFAPLVTACLKGKGLTAKLGSIPPYWVPQKG